MLQLTRNIMYGRLKEPLTEGHGHGAHSAQGAADASHGHAAHPHGHEAPVFATHHQDLNFRELAALAPLLILIVWIGVSPQCFVKKMEPSIAKIVKGLEAARPAGK